jgi:hypothetical protein
MCETDTTQKIAPWVLELVNSYTERDIMQILNEATGQAAAAMKPMAIPNDISGRMMPMVTAPSAMANGYDMQPQYPDPHGMQNFPYAQPHNQQYIAWQLAQQQAAQHPHIPFDFSAMAQGRTPGLDEERLKFQFPVSVFSIYVLTTGE